MNLNVLAKRIAKQEKFYGEKRKPKELSIGDIKEVLKITLIELGKFSNNEIIKTVQRYRRKAMR